jgi:hypothetical protein
VRGLVGAGGRVSGCGGGGGVERGELTHKHAPLDDSAARINDDGFVARLAAVDARRKRRQVVRPVDDAAEVGGGQRLRRPEGRFEALAARHRKLRPGGGVGVHDEKGVGLVFITGGALPDERRHALVVRVDVDVGDLDGGHAPGCWIDGNRRYIAPIAAHLGGDQGVFGVAEPAVGGRRFGGRDSERATRE